MTATQHADTAATAGRSRSATLAYAVSAMLVSYLPLSAVNGVLGTIGTAERATTGQLQWVTDAFTVALTASLMFGGPLAERHGRRRMTAGGLGLTTLGAVLGWLAGGLAGDDAVHLLWVGQATAGVGAGLVMSATLSLIAVTAPSVDARTRGIAIWAAGNVVGLGAGPFVADLALRLAPGADAWRWLFPPVGVLAVAVIAFGLSAAREVATPDAPRPDLLGQAIASVGILALVTGAIRAGSEGPTAPTIAVIAAGVLVLAAFLRRQQRVAAPVVRPALFAVPGFSAATGAAAMMLFTVIGVVFISSLTFAGQHVGSLGIAVRIGFLFLGNAVASVAAGPLQARFGPRVVRGAGLVVTVAGLLARWLTTGTELAAVWWPLALTGAGAGAVVATGTAVALRSVPASSAGMASTAHNIVRQLGGALGPAVVGGVYEARLAAGADGTGAARTSTAVLLVLVLVTTAVVLTVLVRTRDAR